MRFIIILLFSFLFAQKLDINAIEKVHFSMGKLYHLTGHPESSIRYYLKNIRHNLGHENAHQFPLDYHKNGKFDSQHFSFQQALDGVPVFGRYIRVHVNDNIITSISSNIENIDLSVSPIINT